MTKHLKIASMLALSTAAALGLSLVAPNAQAAENEEENIALNEDDTAVEADEGMTDESADAIHRGRFYRWPGYSYYPPPYFYHRPYFPRYRYYHPYYHRPYYRPGIHYRCGPFGCAYW